MSDNQNSVDLESDAQRKQEADEQHSFQLPVAEPHKKSRRAVIIGILVLVTLLVAVAVAIVFGLHPFTSKQVAETPKMNTTFASAQEIIDGIRTEFKGSVLSASTVNSVRAVDSDGYFVYGAPAGTVQGVPYMVLPLESSGTGYVGSSVTAQENYKTLTQYLKAQGFAQRQSVENQSGPLSDSGEEVTYVAYSEYESDDFRCSALHADASGTKLKNHLVSMGCAKKSSYGEAATLLKPYYDAYSKETRSSDVLMGLADTKKQTDGSEYTVTYQEQTLSDPTQEMNQVSTLNGLYYRTSANDAWTFLKAIDSSETPPCSLFTTDMVKKAFKGMECYDENMKKIATVA